MTLLAVRTTQSGLSSPFPGFRDTGEQLGDILLMGIIQHSKEHLAYLTGAGPMQVLGDYVGLCPIPWGGSEQRELCVGHGSCTGAPLTPLTGSQSDLESRSKSP